MFGATGAISQLVVRSPRAPCDLDLSAEDKSRPSESHESNKSFGRLTGSESAAAAEIIRRDGSHLGAAFVRTSKCLSPVGHRARIVRRRTRTTRCSNQVGASTCADWIRRSGPIEVASASRAGSGLERERNENEIANEIEIEIEIGLGLELESAKSAESAPDQMDSRAHRVATLIRRLNERRQSAVDTRPLAPRAQCRRRKYQYTARPY